MPQVFPIADCPYLDVDRHDVLAAGDCYSPFKQPDR